MSDLLGTQIEHYRIDVLLGRGGMGAVYRAYDLNLARPVAFKVMHRHLADQHRFQQRFMQEAQAAARLDHPSIVAIHDFGTEEDLLYMVMSFVSGGNLAGYIKELERQKKAVQLDEILYILAQVADALGYAHAQGVLHRDVKPDNVMLKQLARPERLGEPPLRAVMTDFGLAKLLEGGMQTATGMFMGTLPYMSPEQCMGEQLDGRSDIYSLGVMLYQLITGQLPFNITSPTDAVFKHMQETPQAVRKVRPGVPQEVEDIVRQAMAKKPEDRFQKAEEMAAVLRRAAARLTEEDVLGFAPTTSVFSVVTQLQTSPLETEVAPPPVRVSESTRAASVRSAATTVSISPQVINVKPGGQTAAQITITFGGKSTEYVSVSAGDLPAGWITMSQEPLAVTPGRPTVLPLMIHPPQDNRTPAGRYTLRLQVHSIATQQELASTTGQVMLGAYENFSVELHPTNIKSGRQGRLQIENLGNAPVSFRVVGRDASGAVTFEATAGKLENIAPGEKGTVDMRLTAAGRRPFIGRRKNLPFEIQVSGSEQRKLVSGRLQIRPRVAGWLLALLLIVVLVGGGAAAVFALVQSGAIDLARQNTPTTAAVVAADVTEEIDTAATEAALAAAQTAEAVETSEAQGTVIALTAEAEGDDDNDGLSNLDEERLGTNPNTSDTDGDGLLDGEEINQYDTDPNERDSDGDDLADGEEIRIYKTNPADPDTDGDGILDGVEIEQGSDPLVQPTPTLTPTRTPAPTRTPSPTPEPTETPTPTPRPTAGSTAAGTGGGLPMGFESFGVWGRGDEANGTFTQSGEQAHSGGSSGKLSYDFSTADNDYVVFLQFNDIAGTPNTLRLWVYGDGAGHFLNAWIQDSQGQTWQVPFGQVSHSGWAEMVGRIDTDQNWPWTHISGPNNEEVDYPIRFRGFVLDDYTSSYVGQGEIYLDDLTATTE